MNKENIENAFSNFPTTKIRFFKETDSTNTQALEWLGNGAPEYALVVADSQTSGRGRNGRRWVTTPGSSMAASIIIHPDKHETKKLGLFSLLGGFVVMEVLNDLLAIKAQVKWPNDVLIENMKTAGILSEALWHGETLRGIVLGIGINLLQPSIPPAEGLLFPATCLEAHTDQKIDSVIILTYLMETLIRLRADVLMPAFIKEYEEKLAYRDQLISLDTGAGNITTGILKGVDRFGNVRLQDPIRGDQVFPIGDIKLRPI